MWDKMNGTNPMADAELAWQNIKGTTRMFRWHHFSGERTIKIHPTQKPTQLYKWLLENYVICKSCKGRGGYYEDVAGDGGSQMWQHCEDCNGESPKVLDTHLGSGSIAIACHYLNCDLVGYEIDKEYYDAACKRFKEQTAQQALW